MFKQGDKVEVYFIHPGQHEPLWHRGVVQKQAEQSASYVVAVDSVITQATPVNIRKVTDG
jgi:hypothetical protein